MVNVVFAEFDAEEEDKVVEELVVDELVFGKDKIFPLWSNSICSIGIVNSADKIAKVSIISPSGTSNKNGDIKLL